MKYFLILLAITSLLIVELAHADGPDPTLYQRLGGEREKSGLLQLLAAT